MSTFAERKRAALESLTREALYAAALSLLESEGWMGFTMEKLARAAGVAKGTVYNYFADKREVLLFVLQHNGEELAEELDRLVERESDPATALEELLGLLVRGMYNRRHVIAAAARSAEEDPGTYRDMDPRRRKNHPMWRAREMVESVLRRGVESGAFRPCDPVLVEKLLHATLMGLARLFSAGEEAGSEELVRTLQGLVLQGVRREEATR